MERRGGAPGPGCIPVCRGRSASFMGPAAAYRIPAEQPEWTVEAVPRRLAGGTLDGARRAGAAGPARARDMSGGLLRRVAGRRVLPLPEGDPGRSRPALSPP